MEKLQIVSQPNHISESLSTCDKQTQPPVRSVIFDFFATRLLWPCTAISNIVCLINKNQEPPLELQHSPQPNESVGDSNGSFMPTLQEETSLFQEEVARMSTLYSTSEDEEVKDNRSPEASMLTFPIEKKLLKQAQRTATKYLSKYPPKTGQTKAHPRGTDTSLADFFLGKVTIPGTDLSFWDIVENRDSQPFLQENIDTIMPMLCPSLSPYPDSDTPLLSTRLLYLIQTDPAIASKYLLGVDTLLYFFGFKLSNMGRISAREEDYQACATYVREHQKQRQLYQLINSLLACGFHPLGYNLRGILLDEDMQKEYGLSAQELKNAIGEKKQTSGPLNSRVVAYLLSWFWKAPTKPEYALEDGTAVGQTAPPKSWVSYQAHLWKVADPLYSKFEKGSPPLLVQKMKKGRWYWHLPHLQTPFSNTKKEPKKQKANYGSFISTPQEEISLFQEEVARVSTLYSTFEDEEAKENRSPEAFMLTFPIEKKLLKQAQKISIKYLSKYPPKTGQTKAHPRGTDTSLADFFLGKVAIPGTGLSFWDIVENRNSQPFLQENIDTIMPMLCPSLSPYPDANTPLLSTRLLYLIQTDPAIASKYLLGVTTLLNFFGFKIISNGCISAREEDYQACATYVREHQKQRQLYQLVNSLLTCGFYDLGYTLRGILLDEDTKKEYGLSEQELKSLTKQAFDPAILNHSDATAYWGACAKYELALEDGIAFDQTLPPKIWASYQTHFWKADDPLYSKFEQDSQPLLVRKVKKGHVSWHLPHLQTPFNNTKKEPKK